jgi:DNA-binding NarL/FixJ family response regulator
MMTSIKVILADDHPVVREGIRKLLEQSPEITIIGEASQGEEVLHLVEELTPDVLLLDMEMPGMGGDEVAQKVQESGLPVRILALSAHNDSHYIRGAMIHGASGYLLKEEVPSMILDAVQGVSRGEEGWVSRQVAAQMSSWVGGEEQDSNQLTGREKRVLQGVLAGKTNKEIGLELNISEKTVEKHLETIYPKLGVASRVEAAVYAVREGLDQRLS